MLLAMFCCKKNIKKKKWIQCDGLQTEHGNACFIARCVAVHIQPPVLICVHEFQGSRHPPTESCISSLSISCSELLLWGLRLGCPAVSSGARIKEGAWQLPNLSAAADEKFKPGSFFFFFYFSPRWPCFILHVYSNFKNKKKTKNTHWKGLQWEMASFRILTVSRACFFPNWVTVVKVTITRWRVAALHSYPLHLLLTQWIICYNQLSKPFWSAETQTGQQPMVMETKKQENKKRGR